MDCNLKAICWSIFQGSILFSENNANLVIFTNLHFSKNATNFVTALVNVKMPFYCKDNDTTLHAQIAVRKKCRRSRATSYATFVGKSPMQ